MDFWSSKRILVTYPSFEPTVQVKSKRLLNIVIAGMLALSEAKASKLISLVDIPKARIYQILDELLEMGVIRKKPGKPLRYTALSPDEGLDNMLKWRRERSEKDLNILNESKGNLIEDLRDLAGSDVGRASTKKGFMEIIPAGEISEVETTKAYRWLERRYR